MTRPPIGAYTWIMLAASIAAVAGAIVVWQRRHAPGARWLAALELGVAIWAFGLAHEASSITITQKWGWSVLQYVGAAPCPPLLIWFVLNFTGRQAWTRRRAALLIWLIPLITIGLAATNPLHGWLWPSITIDPATHLATYAHGTWFWIYQTYVYLLTIAAAVMLWRFAAHGHVFYRGQVVAMLLGGILPVGGNLLYVLGYNPVPGADWTPLGFGITVGILAVSIGQLGMFDLVPIARERVVDTISDGLLMLDAQGQIIHCNQAMLSILSPDQLSLAWERAADLSSWDQIQSNWVAQAPDRAKTHLAIGTAEKSYDVRTSPPLAESASEKLYVFRDITEAEQLRQERERLQQRLQDTLAHIETLSGLLPICASCKRIRNQNGTWQTVEDYLSQRTRAEFTHGICPECLERLYASQIDLHAPLGPRDAIGKSDSSE